MLLLALPVVGAVAIAAFASVWTAADWTDESADVYSGGTVLRNAAGDVGRVPHGRHDVALDALAATLDFQQVRNSEIDDVGNGANRRRHAGHVDDRVANGVVVVDAHVGVVEEVLSVRVADEMVLRHFVLPVRRRDGDYLRAALLALLRRVDGGKAKVLLSRMSLPLADVVRKCGYLSLPTFCREFKRLSGFSPEAWRRKESL